jgi:hypothetical protein
MCSLPINVASSIDMSVARRRGFRVRASAQMSTPRSGAATSLYRDAPSPRGARGGALRNFFEDSEARLDGLDPGALTTGRICARPFGFSA